MNKIEDLSPKEKDACYELKRRVSSEITNEKLKNDFYLYFRFLKARNFNLDLAETMLRNHISWRIANQIDSIHTLYEPDEIVVKYLPFQRIGFDKEGSIIRYFDVGRADLKGILKCSKKSSIIKTVAWMLENDLLVMEKQSEKTGKSIQQWRYIFDYEKFSLANATDRQILEFLAHFFMTYDANFPERLKECHIINASTYFTILYSFVKPLMAHHTKEKLKIYGKDGYQQDLLKFIDADVLPAFLGGNKTDPDGNPRCPSIIKDELEVPKSCYLTKNTHSLKDLPDIQKLVVFRGSKIPIELNVIEAGSVIQWEFETECKDIGFALLYKESANQNSESVELIPVQRIHTDFQTETGMFLCEKPGKYILNFDNSHGWMKREIYFKTKVVDPKEQRGINKIEN